MTFETYEWTHFWWEKSQIKEGRILVIGDSICNGYGGNVQKNFGEVPVDRFSTSFSVDNPNLRTEIKIFLEGMGLKYKVIHFNNGLHGKHITLPEYEKLYEELVVYMLSVANGAKLMLATSTPVTTPDKLGYNEFNAEVIKRNEVVARIAAKYNLPLDDLYTAADKKPEIYSGDGYHYNAEGWEMLGEKVSDFIKANMD